MSKLDDLLGKKKEIIPVLDLSKTIAHTKDEYKRLLERVPDFKMRPIKVRIRIKFTYNICSVLIEKTSCKITYFDLWQVRSDEIKIKDKDFHFKTPKRELKYLLRHNGERERQYEYLNPVPVEMRSLVIMELCAVPIDWKMLTTLRPKIKIEVEYYSK